MCVNNTYINNKPLYRIQTHLMQMILNTLRFYIDIKKHLIKRKLIIKLTFWRIKMKKYFINYSILLGLIGGCMNLSYATDSDQDDEDYRPRHVNQKAFPSSSSSSSFSSKVEPWRNVRAQYLVGRSLSLNPTPSHLVEEYSVSLIPLNAPTQKTISLPNHQEGSWNWMTSVEDQGDLGTCASFSVVECLKYQHRRLLSQPYLITNAETDGDDCLNNGLPIGVAMKWVHKKGVIGQSWWPYQSYRRQISTELSEDEAPTSNTNVCVVCPLSKNEQEELIKFGVKNVKNVFTVERDECLEGDAYSTSKSLCVKSVLHFYQVPISISVAVLNNQEWDRTGNITTVPKTTQPIKGWHAITIYEADDKNKLFRFKNSWGTSWGNGGHGVISYDYVNRYATEAWVGYEKALRQ